MFEQTEGDISFPSRFVQQMIASVVPLAVLLVSSPVVSMPDNLSYIPTMLVSIALASIAARLFPDSMTEARWVWIIPVCVETLLFFPLLFNHPADVVDLFYLTNKPETGWGFFLFTMPTWSSCCYSATATFWARRLERL